MKPASAHRPPSSLEPLEDRIALANDVQTSLLNGTLTITTVDQLGEAEILANDNDQSFSIVGTGLGSLTVNQTGATTVDGGATATFTGVTKIVVKLKLGDDSLTVETLDIAGDFQFDGGENANTLTFDALAGVTKLRNIAVTNGPGRDEFTIAGASTVIAGNVTVNNGNGGCDVSIGNIATDDVTIRGNVKITNGFGVNVIGLIGNDVRIDGTVKVKSGTGSNVLSISVDNSLVISKPLSVVHGLGPSLISVNNLTAMATFASVRIDHADGDSILNFNSSISQIIKGDLVINNGAGEDVLTIDTQFFTVEGRVKINNGNGDATTDLSPGTSNTVIGAFKLVNGAGTHTTTISGGRVQYQGVSIRSVAGETRTEFAATTALTLGGPLQIINGDGEDSLVVKGTGTHLYHSIAINNGVGGGFSLFDPVSLTITGSLSVNALNGGEGGEIGRSVLDNFTIGSVTVKSGGLGSSYAMRPGVSGTIEGGIKIVGGSNSDYLEMRRVAVKGAMTLNLGDGNNSVVISDSAIEALTVTTGTGSDKVTFESLSNTDVGTVIGGIVKIILGAGDDFVRFGHDSNDAVTATRPILLDGGTQIDTLTLVLGNSFAVPPVIRGFEVVQA